MLLSCGEDAVIFQMDLRDSKPGRSVHCQCHLFRFSARQRICLLQNAFHVCFVLCVIATAAAIASGSGVCSAAIRPAAQRAPRSRPPKCRSTQSTRIRATRTSSASAVVTRPSGAWRVAFFDILQYICSIECRFYQSVLRFEGFFS